MSEHSFAIDPAFAELVARYLDDALTDPEHAELNRRLLSDSTVRTYFWIACRIAGQRHDYGRESAPPVIVTPDAAPKPRTVQNSPKPTPFIIYPIAIAAAALLTAAIVVVYLIAFTTEPKPDPIQPNQPGPSVATLIENTGDLRTPHGYPAEGDDYSAGEFTLTSGKAEFMLTNSVNVKLRGDTRMFMRNDMNVELARGTASFVCPTGTEGYTVHLPDGSRVVDLGTAFTVRVVDGEFHIRVGEGSVRFEPGAASTADSRVLTHGQSLRFDPSAHRIVAEFDTSDYAALVLSMDPLLYLPMEPRDATLTVYDEVNAAHAGYKVRGKQTEFIDGKSGQAIALGGDRSPGYIVTTDWKAPTTDQYSVTAWVYAQSASRYATIAKNWGEQTGGLFHLDLWRDTGAIAATVRTKGGDVSIKDPEKLRLNQWHHVAMVVDGQRLTLYRNGERIAQSTLDHPITSTPAPGLGIGAKPNNAGDQAVSGYWHGRLDEVAIFDHALSESEVRELFESATTQPEQTAPKKEPSP